MDIHERLREERERLGLSQVAVATGTAKAARAAGLACDGKRYCKDMDSCDEARHYLTRCGVRSLDRDGDGVPCESLCGGR